MSPLAAEGEGQGMTHVSREDTEKTSWGGGEWDLETGLDVQGEFEDGWEEEAGQPGWKREQGIQLEHKTQRRGTPRREAGPGHEAGAAGWGERVSLWEP